MFRRERYVSCFALITWVFTASVSNAQQEQGQETQVGAARGAFAAREDAALAEPFVGIRTARGSDSGLFPIRATGVSTESIRAAAVGFLSALSPDQRRATQFEIEDNEWRRWSNIDAGGYERQGVSFREMTLEQRDAARSLLEASLSLAGVEIVEAIRKTDHTLAEIHDDWETFGEDLYYLTLMGTPSSSEPWGWQLDGHHLVINYFVLGDPVVMTPTFLGGEPIQTTTGKYAGNVLLRQEQDLGLKLVQTLSAEQAHRAILASRKSGRDLKAGANSDNLILDYAGVPVSTFSDSQRTLLLELVSKFIGNLPPAHARVRMEEIAEHLDSTWFAWVGSTSDDAVFYYRIHSPVVLIEFDHQSPVGTRKLNPTRGPTRDHIHVIVRTPNGNDYGKDLLQQHLEQHSHD